MSKFDKLSLEIVSRPNISDSERLGLAELQLQRARRMHLLTIGDDEESNEAVAGLTQLRDESLDKAVAKRNRQQEEELAKLPRRDVADVHEEDKAPSQADTHSRTPTPAMTPASRDANEAPQK